jgi:sugar fermentation stimulation protein A
MQLPPLQRATLLRRYKRFLADVRLEDGREETVHVPNSGSMLGLADPGLPVWLSHSASRTRKLPHTLELVEVDGALVGVNTLLPNRLAAEALAEGALIELAGYESIRAEVRYGEASRVDFLLQAKGRPSCWLEVKNVHLRRQDGLAEFPDCVAARSLKHLRELSAMVAGGDRAVMLFIVQRTDCERFDTAHDLDPVYAQGLRDAFRQGVEVLCYGCDVDLGSIRVARPLPWTPADLTIRSSP